MNSKIINPSQYKKISKEKRRRREKNIEENIRKGKSSINNDINDIFGLHKRENTKKSRIIYGILSIIGIFVISISSAAILKVENSSILNVFENLGNNNINYDIDLKIACNNLDFNKNVLLCELKNLSYNSILNFDNKYNITYNLAERVSKIDSLNYEIKFKDKNINEKVRNQILLIKSNPDNIYYQAISNINDVVLEDSYNMKIVLSQPNDYFIFYLDFPVEQEDEKLYNYYRLNLDSVQNKATLNKNVKLKKGDVVNSISLLNYSNNINVIDDFKNKKVDMFFTTNEDDMKLLGRYDYTCKKYRDGETYFIFGNKNSKLFSKLEVRKAIAYAIDRNKIVKSISTSFAEVIDIPYIYSAINYKYDVYASNNLLIANSWSKSGGIYSKKDENTGERLVLSLKLVVNEEDTVRCQIADEIKQMLGEVGIKLSVAKLDNNKLNETIQNGDYDILLAKVYIGKSPDITFIKDYINISENVNSALSKVSNSSVLDLTNSVQELQNVLSNEVACIGIAAKNTNVVLQKNILGIEEIEYMRIFKDISKVGISK